MKNKMLARVEYEKYGSGTHALAMLTAPGVNQMDRQVRVRVDMLEVQRR